jgi:hypothetical protein
MVRPGRGRKPTTVWPGTVLDAYLGTHILDAELIVVRNRGEITHTVGAEVLASPGS